MDLPPAQSREKKKQEGEKGDISNGKANFPRNLQQTFTRISLASIVLNRYPILQDREKNMVLLGFAVVLFWLLTVFLNKLLQREISKGRGILAVPAHIVGFIGQNLFPWVVLHTC